MSLPYYPMYPRDFFEGTQEMNLEQKGAYIMVLNLMYTRGGPISDDPVYISRYIGCSITKWTGKTGSGGLRDQLVAMGKLRVDGATLTNARADGELTKLREYSDGKARNRANPNKNNEEESRARTTHAKSKPEPEAKVDDLPRVAPQYADLTEEFLDDLEANCRKWANGALVSRAGPLVLAPIVRLLRPISGPTCTMDDVKNGIMKAAESLHRRGEQVGLAYFEKPILQARDERLKPLPEPEITHGRHQPSSASSGFRAGRGRGQSPDIVDQAFANLGGFQADPDVIEHPVIIDARRAS